MRERFGRFGYRIDDMEEKRPAPPVCVGAGVRTRLRATHAFLFCPEGVHMDKTIWFCVALAFVAAWIDSVALAAGSVGVIAGIALSEYVNRS